MGNMIAILGHIDVDPAVRDDVLAATVDLQRATQTAEPGCVIYTFAADPTDPGRIRIVELWATAEALDAHFQHPNFVATAAVMRRVERLGGSISKYRIDAVDEVRGADGMATSRFSQGDVDR
jgi:quinol monooxygenase YgiN